ncbi:M14 family metallopeptidase [Sunxiuqinia indica]|uniref:M14 family metallopeptidase n=1 Tax=Sunxiuqinia indica TaxID=2692584 RepID=UPI00135AA807|nr:M14 family metallopeptidase [Sunxiuqinia indica]
MEYFYKTYEECRNRFRNVANELSSNYNNARVGKIKVDSMIDPDLTVDWLYIPAQQQPRKLLVLTSGLHGIEGFTGSAIQLMFIDRILSRLSLEELGVVFIHGLNPYGFKYFRKVTENNVDLNRNCVINPRLYQSINAGYSKMSNLLIPKGELSIDKLQYRFFHLNAIYKIIKESLPILRQAALQGQYEYERGIYYGGKRLEPQLAALEPLLRTLFEDYQSILSVDLHTGYGKRGKMHLFLNPINDEKVLAGLDYVLDGEKINWGSDADFYTINGEYLEWMGQLANEKLCIPIRFEYGTLDSQKTLGALKSIQIMISENQGAQFGFKDQKSKDRVMQDFLDMYYPSTVAWRSKVLTDSSIKMSKIMNRFLEYEVAGADQRKAIASITTQK